MPYMSSRKAIIQLGWSPISLEKGINTIISEIKGKCRKKFTDIALNFIMRASFLNVCQQWCS